MQVLAAPGLKVPKEDKPRDYITDTPPEGEAGYTVPDTVYYTRRLLDGDLVDVAAPPATPAVTDVVEVAPVAPAKKKGGA